MRMVAWLREILQDSEVHARRYMRKSNSDKHKWEKIREATREWLGHVGRNTEEDIVTRAWKMEVS